METNSIIIMEKEKDTGFLEKELGSYSIESGMDLVYRIFAEKENDSLIVNMYITAPGDFEDWQYNAILDNYNLDLYEGKVISIEEDEDSYNPQWILKFDFSENHKLVEDKINEILEIHGLEIKRVLENIKSLEDEYKE